MWTSSRVLPRFRSSGAAGRLTAPLLREKRTWIVITVFWVLIGIGSWLLEYALSFGSLEGPMPLGRAAARLVDAVLWFGVSVCTVWVSDAFTVRHARQYIRIAFHLLVGVVVAVSWALLAYAVNLAIIPGWEPTGAWTMVSTTFGTTYVSYIGMIALAHGIIIAREHHAREVETLEEARASVQAQLHVLKMELQPHFLFNTLHAISGLMHRDVKVAQEMLVLLADMLNDAVHTVRDQEVTLEEELKTLKLYIQIQQIRFGDRLRVDYDIDGEALGARVPHLMFQPLVENAIKHGIGDCASGGQVEVSARVSGAHLQLAVQDDGPGLPDGQLSYGVGLTNTQERLSYLYGGRHRFELRDAPGGGVRATVTIPLSKGDTLNPGS